MAQTPEDGSWFTRLPEEQTVYVNFRRYDDLADRAGRLLAMVEERSAKRLIIDLRQNGGGNYTVARHHLLHKLQMIPSVNRPGGLYVSTGRGTFSAAMTNATDFRRETDAILVGEPTGARPNGYQQLGQFTLPNSKLRATCALLHYRFQHGDGPAGCPTNQSTRTGHRTAPAATRCWIGSWRHHGPSGGSADAEGIRPRHVQIPVATASAERYLAPQYSHSAPHP